MCPFLVLVFIPCPPYILEGMTLPLSSGPSPFLPCGDAITLLLTVIVLSFSVGSSFPRQPNSLPTDFPMSPTTNFKSFFSSGRVHSIRFYPPQALIATLLCACLQVDVVLPLNLVSTRFFSHYLLLASFLSMGREFFLILPMCL